MECSSTLYNCFLVMRRPPRSTPLYSSAASECIRDSYGGGFVIRPVYKAGDIGVVVYLDRDSDAVIAGGAEADPNTERLHSGDDAVFVGGIRTGGSSISGLPAGSLSLGTSDGGVYLSISPSGIDIKGNVTITGDLTVTGGVVNLN